MTIPHRLRYALGPPNCLGPLHTSRQRPTRRFEIYHCQISPDKPLLWQTCLNSPHASQQVKIFYRPTKNRLVCASLRPVFNYSIGKLNQSDHSSQSLTKDTGNPVNYLTLTGCPGKLMGLDIQLAPRVFSTKFWSILIQNQLLFHAKLKTPKIKTPLRLKRQFNPQTYKLTIWPHRSTRGVDRNPTLGFPSVKPQPNIFPFIK